MDGKISAERLRSLFFVGKSLGLEWSLERTAEAPPQRGSSIFCHPGWLSGLNLPPSSQCPAFERRYWDSVNRLKGEVWSNSIIHAVVHAFFPWLAAGFAHLGWLFGGHDPHWCGFDRRYPATADTTLCVVCVQGSVYTCVYLSSSLRIHPNPSRNMIVLCGLPSSRDCCRGDYMELGYLKTVHL